MAYHRLGQRRRERLLAYLADNWLLVLATVATLAVTLTTLTQFLVDPFELSQDSAMFQHGGWYVTQGATPYVDFFDVKPPLIYAVTAALALLSGGNMAVLHVLSVTVAAAASIAGVVLVGRLNYELTGDGLASLLAGLTMFAITTLYDYPAAGIRPKYLAFALGTAGLLLAVRDRPAGSGALAAASAGVWQLSAPLVGLVAAIGYVRNGRRSLGRVLAGVGLVTAAVVGPYVLAGAVEPVLVEAVLAPLLGNQHYTLAGRFFEIVLELGPGALVLPVGAYGLLRAGRRAPRRYWWACAGGGLYLLQLLVEMQGALDVVVLVAFMALGVGHLAARASTPSRQSMAAAAVLLLLLSAGYWNHGSITPVRDEVEDAQEAWGVPSYERLPADPAGVPSIQTIYWEQREPANCHYLGDIKQKAYLRQTGGSVERGPCGQWPFEEPPLEWLFGHVLTSGRPPG